MSNHTLLAQVVNIAIAAGDVILNVYEKEYEIAHKADGSPVTTADHRAHDVIVEQLQALTPDIPVLSEESKGIDVEDRLQWPQLWLVDPLDGTKEFIKGNGEFTVNIALIQDGNPVLGVIWVPVKSILYFGEQALGAYKISNLTKLPTQIEDFTKDENKLPIEELKDEFVVVASRSHLSDETSDFIENLKKKHNKVTTTSMGSSLKLCLVAEGKANIYPRFAPTMEWDTAAGQAIVQASGKIVKDYKTRAPLRYNKKSLLNNWFIVE